MSEQDAPPVELIGELGQWDVLLVTGDVIHLAAHGYSCEDGMYEFVDFFEGKPPVRVPVCRIPEALVARVRGG